MNMQFTNIKEFISLRTLIALALLLTLYSCGPSNQEKREIAIVTCNIMSESIDMDGAMRIREVNSAREKIGENLFLQSDSAIVESFQYGLCEELVLNDPAYDAKLSAVQREREEAARIAREEREEALRVALERNRREYTDSIKSMFDLYPPNPTFASLNELIFGRLYKVFYQCSSVQGFDLEITIKFKNNLGSINQSNTGGLCLSDGTYGIDIRQSDLNGEILELFDSGAPKFFNNIESITIGWNGEITVRSARENLNLGQFIASREKQEMSRRLDRSEFGGVDPYLSELPHEWIIYSSSEQQ